MTNNWKSEKKFILIDVAMPMDKNIVYEQAENKSIYRGLHNHNRRSHMECNIIPVIAGATGVVTKGLKENFGAEPGKHTNDSLQI
jgi:hypothetical protein